MSIDVTPTALLINGKEVDPEIAVALHPWIRKYIRHLLKK